ncbi:RNA polymerase sigma factor [Nocardioides marmorisolisilvae]|uniref:SigE family RNA polymerase sigma factor n=1 Tax=Nocardioides marmorisolisilvae TaxID=1542737 RepID=A0A3N0DTV4_9ACTN|nr:SigE family RNA polymerase sigma factor [Nocardioides marmorisolisilvae]RNL79054.1 SigE family RNA polymerase sigma factor [Nocardioides marmorisolisilvae]
MDEAEFDEFYTSSFGRITGQLYAMIGDRDEAQECVQEAFVRAWQHRGKLAKADHPEAWVRTAAYRLAVSRWRRKKLAARPADRALSSAPYAAPVDETRVALLAALQQLPDKQRQALVLHHLVDLPVQDVAREVGVPEGTIKARLSRGRTALASLLATAGTDATGANHV